MRIRQFSIRYHTLTQRQDLQQGRLLPLITFFIPLRPII